MKLKRSSNFYRIDRARLNLIDFETSARPLHTIGMCVYVCVASTRVYEGRSWKGMFKFRRRSAPATNNRSIRRGLGGSVEKRASLLSPRHRRRGRRRLSHTPLGSCTMTYLVNSKRKGGHEIFFNHNANRSFSNVTKYKKYGGLPKYILTIIV